MTRTVGALLMAFTLVAAMAAAQEPNGGDRPTRAERQDRPAAVKPSAATPLNLNTATAAQLETLPGIGARTAERIVEYRQKNGGFKKIEELMNVPGVGEKSFLKLKSLITVTPPKVERVAQA
jgi:competence ComEA-like helix-hairpin-helix protein